MLNFQPNLNNFNVDEHKGESRKVGESGKADRTCKVTLLSGVGDQQFPNPLVLSLSIDFIRLRKLLPALRLRFYSATNATTMKEAVHPNADTSVRGLHNTMFSPLSDVSCTPKK